MKTYPKTIILLSIIIIVTIVGYFFINQYSKPYVLEHVICKPEPYAKVGSCRGYDVKLPDADFAGCSATHVCLGIFSKGDFLKEEPERCTYSGVIDVKAYDLNTVSGRQGYYDFLLTKRACQIWGVWDATILRASPNEMSTVVAALGHALATDNSSDKMYSKISERLYDPSKSLTEKVAVIDAFRYARTPLAVKYLFAYATSSEPNHETMDGPLYAVSDKSRDVLREISMTLVDGAKNWNVSQAFEDAWRSIQNNETPKVTKVVGEALGYLSKPSGIELLLNTIVSDTTHNTIKYKVAAEVISNLRYNDPVETVLAPAVVTYQNDKNITNIVVKGLISINSADSIIVALKYLDSIKASDPATYKMILRKIKQSNNSEVIKVVSEWPIKNR